MIVRGGRVPRLLFCPPPSPLTASSTVGTVVLDDTLGAAFLGQVAVCVYGPLYIPI